MSGELRAEMNWTPADPVVEKPRPKKVKHPPVTRRGMVLHGLVRFALISGGLSGGIALIGLLIVWRGGGSAARVFPLCFYVGGALLAASAFFGGTGTYDPEYWDRSEREYACNMSFVYGVFGIGLIGIGAVLENFLF